MSAASETGYDPISCDSKAGSTLSNESSPQGRKRSLSAILGAPSDGSSAASADTINMKIGLTKFVIMLLGVGYLFPFSALTQPVDYWNELFPGRDMDFFISAVFMYSNLIALTIIIFVLPEFSYTLRIVGGFCGQAFILFFVAISYYLHLQENLNFALVLVCTGIIAVITAFLDSACLSLAARFPIQIQESLQLGIGVSTLIGSIYRVITKLIFPPEQVVLSSLLYFFTGTATLLACVIGYYVLLKTPLGKERLGFESGSSNSTDNEEAQMLLQQHGEELSSLSSEQKKSILKKVFLNGFYAFILFCCTLALWPGLISVMPCYSNPQLGDWWPLILLTIFSITDTLGRFLINYRCGLTTGNIWIPIVLRMLIVPCLVLCKTGIYFASDFYSVIFTVIMGFTNGYIGSLALLFIVELVEEDEAGYAGSLIAFFLNSGLVVGSTIGLVIAKF